MHELLSALWRAKPCVTYEITQWIIHIYEDWQKVAYWGLWLANEDITDDMQNLECILLLNNLLKVWKFANLEN